MHIAILALALVLTISVLANDALSLQVAPRAVYQHSIYGAGEVIFTIRLDRAGWLCHGWEYPIVQLDKVEWPMRRSCSWTDRKLVQRYWGGRGYPFPYVGDYKAYAELYASEKAVRPGVRIEAPFRVLEGIP